MIAGQHRVHALQKFVSLQEEDDSQLGTELWWLCDIYDRGMFPTLFTRMLLRLLASHTNIYLYIWQIGCLFG